MPNPKIKSSVLAVLYIDTNKFPKVEVHSKNFSKTGHDLYELLGLSTMNGITKEALFNVVFNGFAYPGEKSICVFSKGKN